MLKTWDNHQKWTFRLLRNQPVVQSHQTGQGERFHRLEVKTFTQTLEILFDWTIYTKMYDRDQPAAQEKAMPWKFTAVMWSKTEYNHFLVFCSELP